MNFRLPILTDANRRKRFVTTSNRQDASRRLNQVLGEIFGLDELELDFGIQRLLRSQLAEVQAFVTRGMPEAIQTGVELGLDVDLACRCLHEFWRGYLDGKFAGDPQDYYFVKATGVSGALRLPASLGSPGPFRARRFGRDKSRAARDSRPGAQICLMPEKAYRS